MNIRLLANERDCPLERRKIHQQARVESAELRPSEARLSRGNSMPTPSDGAVHALEHVNTLFYHFP